MCYKTTSLIILLLLILSYSCGLQSKEAIYIIPQNYVGAVVIVFDQPNGVVPETEDGFTVYRIPENGLLKVNKKAVYKIVKEKYFYEDLTGKRTEIEYIYPTSQVRPSDKSRKTFDQVSSNDKTVYAMGGEMGSFNSRDETVRYRPFTLGIASESGELNQQALRKVTELQKTMR